MSKTPYLRPQVAELARRLKEPRRLIHAITGARQVGKTTLALQVAERGALPFHFAGADEPTLRGDGWIETQWEQARLLAGKSGPKGALLILDEVQKVPQWSDTVKHLWDEDSRKKTPVKIVLLGSAPLLVDRGMTESLAGRFETLHLPHWSFVEMQQAFGWNLQQYLFYGAYPGAAPLINQPQRWARYVVDSLIETTITRDVLLLSRIDKPALLRRLFELGTRLFGANSFLYQNDRAASGCRQHHNPRQLSRTADGSRRLNRATQIRRRRGPAARLQPEVSGFQYRADNGSFRPDKKGSVR